MSLPRADDLFRATVADGDETSTPASSEDEERGRRPSGRVRHDEKMTVYITSDELLEIEHARLTLRRSHAMAVDRGRLVREALSIVLADLEDNGASSALVRRLSGA